MKVTAVGDVITAVVTALNGSVAYPIFDGPISNRPGRTKTSYVVIGGEDPYNDEAVSPINSASMSSVWRGIGPTRSRDETLQIPCVAVGIATKGDVATARAEALAVVQDVLDNLSIHPTDETYGAQVSDITAIESRNLSGGAEVQAKFTISAMARLV